MASFNTTLGSSEVEGSVPNPPLSAPIIFGIVVVVAFVLTGLFGTNGCLYCSCKRASSENITKGYTGPWGERSFA